MAVLLDGINPKKEWGLIFLQDHYHPATPEMRNRTMTIPGMPGDWDFGSEWGSRTFNLPFAIIEYDRYELQRKIRAFVAFLLDSYGRPRPIKLSFDYEPDVFYTVKLSDKVDVERAVHTMQFNLSLIAHDPFAYADSTYKKPEAVTGITYDSGYFYPTTLDDVYMDSETITFGDPFFFTEAYHPNYYYENPAGFDWIYHKHYTGIHNYGGNPTDLIIEINGSVRDPKVTNQTTGETLYLPTITNQVLKVDTKKFTVKVNDKSLLTSVSGDFPNLNSGENSFLFEGHSPNATVTFKWNHKFM